MSWFTRAEQEKRNAHIMELYAMGHDRRYIAEKVDLTPQRVSQIINDFGYGYRTEIRRDRKA
jgi:hypothetical protein